MSEVGEQEKIDIVIWDDSTKEYIINALSPTTQATQTPQSDINQQNNSSTTNMPTDNSKPVPTVEAPSVSSNSGVKVQPKL